MTTMLIDNDIKPDDIGQRNEYHITTASRLNGIIYLNEAACEAPTSLMH